MKKGMELPTNALVIFILAIIVLLALLGMFGNVWSGSSNTLNMENTKNTACQRFMTMKYCSDDTKKITNANAITISDQVKCACIANADAKLGTNTNAIILNLTALSYCCYNRDPIALCCR